MWIQKLHEWTGQGLPCALATVTEAWGSTPRKTGAKLVVNAKGEAEGSVGGGAIEHRCLLEAPQILALGEPRTLRFVLDGDWRGARPGERPEDFAGAVGIFLEPVLPAREVVAFGAGHIAERLARLCAALGLPFRVCDARPEFARPERFPSAAEVVCAPYDRITERFRLSPASHCVVLTHGHAHDGLVLEQLLRQPFLPYIGMVGSSRKSQDLREQLAEKGLTFGPQVFTPAGLALGGRAPEDIALAILAEIKLVMEGGQPGHLRH